MSEHGSSGTQLQGLEAHRATYEGFLKGSVVLAILSFYILVSLVAFAFINNYNLLIGFGGLIIGIICLLIDVRAGNKWYLSAGWLVVFALITAVSLS